MEEQPPKAPLSPTASRPWPIWLWLLMLVVIVSGFRSWQVWRTEVLARDSIGFICLAWQLEHLPTREVLQQSEYHPGYSLLILLTSIPLRQFGVTPDSIALQMAAQLVSVVASVLLIFPMFFLGRALFNVRVAFWACLLFQFLPAPGRVLPDGLNEATYLLFAVTALGLAWLALRRRAAIWFGLCGVCGGLAYLIRPEGALIVVVTALVLVAGQSVAGWRRPWTSVLSGMAALLLCAVVIGGPLYLLSGRIILKPSGKVLESSEATPVLPENVPAARQQISEGSVSGSPLWAVWWIDERQTWPTLDWRWGTQAVLHEAIKGFYHVLWLPALFGLMWFWRRTSSEPGAWVIGLVCLGIFGLLLRLASMMGYVSDRHMLLIVLCGCFWIVAGLEVWTQWLAKFARRWVEPARAVPWGCGILVVMAIVTAIPKLSEPLHSDRSGFREVGLWLAQRLGPDDVVVDPYRWPGYFSGQDFRPPVPFAQARTRYFVYEESPNPHGHLALHKQAELLKPCGHEVYSWSGQRGKHSVKIIVFTLPRRG